MARRRREQTYVAAHPTRPLEVTQLVRHALRKRHGGQPARLRHDHATRLAPRRGVRHEERRELRALSAAGGAADQADRMVADHSEHLVSVDDHRQGLSRGRRRRAAWRQPLVLRGDGRRVVALVPLVVRRPSFVALADAADVGAAAIPFDVGDVGGFAQILLHPRQVLLRDHGHGDLD